MSSLNEIAMYHLGNGVEGGRCYSACPQPFLSSILDGKFKKRRERFFLHFGYVLSGPKYQLQLYEYHLCSSVHTYKLGFIKTNLVQ
jgi:hypothetical protein